MKKNESNQTIPRGLDYTAGLSWRLLVILGVIGVLIFLIMLLKILVIPFLVAILVTALLFPLVQLLTRVGFKRGLAVATSLVAMLVIVGGLGTLLVWQVRSSYPDLSERSKVIYTDVSNRLAAEPFNIDKKDINSYADDVTTYARENSGILVSGIASFGSAATHVVTGFFLVIFAVIFMLLDGKNIWRWTTNLFPTSIRPRLLLAGRKGWKTLINFVKSQVAVAGVDAVGIGLGALLLGVPLAIPIAVMVFLGSFIPVVGALVTGAIAVVIALAFNGWGIALAMLGVVILVQFAESHLLQPFLIGKAVSIHPLAIIFAVAAGSLIAGIPGALFAVPIAAVLNVMIATLINPAQSTEPAAKTTK